MEYHNTIAEIITAVAPIAVAVLALIQARMARVTAKENKAKIDKVETALYESPMIDGPYKEKRKEDIPVPVDKRKNPKVGRPPG